MFELETTFFYLAEMGNALLKEVTLLELLHIQRKQLSPVVYTVIKIRVNIKT